MLVVDNGSTDATAAVAAAHGARVVREPRRGYGAAVHAGLLAARAELVAVLDGDGSLDPAVLEPMAAAVRAGADLAVGRRVPEARGVWPWHARAGNARSPRCCAAAGCPCTTSRRSGSSGGRRCSISASPTAASAIPWNCCCAPERPAGGSQEFDVAYRPRAGGRSKVSGSVRGTVRAATAMVGLLR